MTNVEQDKIVDRIRKLAAMATSTNEAEAAAFAEKVQAELLKYNLTMADIHEKGDATDDEVIIDSSIQTTPQPWRRKLGMGVSEMYLCAYFYVTDTRANGKTKFDAHSFVGSKANVAVAKMMFAYLEKTVDRLAQEGCKGLPKKEHSPYRGTFRDACVLRLRYRIAARIEDAKKGGVVLRIDAKPGESKNLPALLGMFDKAKEANAKAIDEQVGKLRTTKSKPVTKHEQARRDGYAAGDKIGLDGQVGHDQQKRLA